MKNTFYQSFDFETIPGLQRRDDYRSPFELDRDRIIYSAFFRRLQSKTQVFLSGEYDFYRTRLTHSIEVAQIGRSICHQLCRREELLSDDFYIDDALVEAVCLAHDLGHPPFGHAGERTLHDLMREWGGFEGNAQTLRIVTEMFYQNGSRFIGMSPTRAFLDGILKYKCLFSDVPGAEHHFIYDDQADLRNFVFGGRPVPEALGQGDGLNGLKSIECQIMDWADDTAYSLNDIVDGVRAGFLTLEKIERWMGRRKADDEESTWMSELGDAIRSAKVDAVFSRKIGTFLQACRLERAENFLSGLTNRHAYRLVIDERARKEARFYKQLAVDVIFRSPPLQQMEYKGGLILGRLWEALGSQYVSEGGRKLGILGESEANRVREADTDVGRWRRVCDHLAMMTDGTARRTYQRLTDPEFGSFVDLG